jgi:hypothetical protein
VKKWLYSIIAVFALSWAHAQRPSIPGMGGLSGGASGSMGQGGQVKIDDSTKMIYGPRTTRFFLEEDVFNNQKALYQIDTAYDAFHRYNFIQRANFEYVDLGNLGTASRSVFFRPVRQLGAQFGYDAYSLYAYPVNEVKYYDTKSPYTNLYLVLGGLGQNILRFDHSQNLSPRLNLGLMAQRMTTNKFFGTSGSSDPQNNLAQNWSFVFNGSYRSANDKYTVMGQFNHLNHAVYEQGGMVPDSTAFKTGQGEVAFFNDPNRPSILKSAQSWERRNNWHVYQQYVLAQGFQLYHVFDYQRSINNFSHATLSEGAQYGFYRNYFYSRTATQQEVKLRAVDNRFGIKGRYRGFNYRLHYRPRFVNMNGAYNATDTTQGTYKLNRFENFVGLWLNYYFKDSTQRATAEFEYLLLRDIKLKGELISKWFSAGYESVFSSPSLLQQRYESNHFRWDNSFQLVNSNNIYGQINLRTKKITFSPRLDYHLINNYIYFDSVAIPRQELTPFSVVRMGANVAWRPGKFQFLSQSYYTLVSNGDVLRIPKFFANFRATFDFVYYKVLYLQLGAEMHYKSAYFADAYMPVTQQFYLQNRLKTEGVVYSEVFVNARINRVRLFVKMANALQGFAYDGYFSSPLFPNVGRSLGFGVNWPLFD